MRIKKWLWSWVACLVLFVGMPALAADVPEVKSYINDYANVIDQSTEQALNALGKELADQSGSQVVVVTVDSLDGQDAAMLATKIGNNAGVGSDKDNGVVILVSMNDREYFMAVGSGLEGDLTDIEANRLQQTYLVPYFQAGQYSKGIESLYKAVADEISPGIAGTYTSADPSGRTVYHSTSSMDAGTFIMMVFVFIFLVFIALFAVFSLVVKKSPARQDIEIGVGESWPMKVRGFDFQSGTVFVSVADPSVVRSDPGGVLTGLRPGRTTVTVQKSGEQPHRFDITVTSGYHSGRRNDDLLNALFWGSVIGSASRRRRYYGPGYGFGPGYRPGPGRTSRPSGGFGGSRGFGGGGGFRGGGGGFRGGGAGGKW